MKTLFLTIAIFIFVNYGAHSQSAANYYNNGKYLHDKAIEKLAKMSVFNKKDNQEIIGLFNSSAESYSNTKKQMPGTMYIADYNSAVNLYKAALQYHLSSDDANAYSYLKKAIELWPKLNGIPESKVIKETSVFQKGYIYTFPATTVSEERLKYYYEIRYLASVIAKSQGKNEEAMAYEKEVADNAKDIPEIIWQCAYDIALAMQKGQQSCEAAAYAFTCIDNACKTQPTGDKPGLLLKNKMVEEMMDYVVAADSNGCLKKGILEKSVIALASMDGNWTPKVKYTYFLGERIYNNGGHSFGLLYNEYKLARTHNDPDVSETWRKRINENGKYFSSAEWKILADYYGTLSYTDARMDALDNARKKERKEHTRFLVAIEPTVIPLGQYAVSIGYLGIRVSHELRFAYIADGIKPYLKSSIDTEKVPVYLVQHYSGYQISYALKILSQGDNKKEYTYLGTELRYTARNYSDLITAPNYTDQITYYNKSNPTERYNKPINPHANVYDACLIFGVITTGKLFYYEIFGGVGVGYKTISYSNFDPNVYQVANAPFNPDLWNKLYVPVRFGVRIGLAMK